MPAALRPRTMAALSCLAAAWHASFAVALPKITCSGTEVMAFWKSAGAKRPSQ